MLIISYDIKDDKLRAKFSRMITRNGAIRLQFSVYEVNSTKRVIDNIKVKIDTVFAPKFCFDDSIMIFNVANDNIVKYGNAIHRDKDLLFFG